MRELDVLLESYLDRAYLQADHGQKQAFRALLALPEPELIAYLLHGQTPADPAIVAIVEQIRERPHA